MRNLDLDAYGVSEITMEETTNTKGGFWPAFLAGAIVGGLIYDAAKWLYMEALECIMDGAGNGAYEGMSWGR